MITKEEVERTTLRITPHRLVLNQGNRRLMAVLHDLLVVDRNWRVDGGRLVVTPRPDFWWIVELTPEDAKFYIDLPTQYVDAFKTKLRGHEQWKKCTVEEVDGVPIPTQDTNLYRLTLKHHDMFSLSFDYGHQGTPIRDVLNVTRELKEGEGANIFIRAEPIPRRRWKAQADYAWEVWNKGGMPYRSNLHPRRLLSGATYLVAMIIYELQTLLADVMNAISRSFFPSQEEPAEKPNRPTRINKDREAMLVNGDLSHRTKAKRNLPAFKTSIWYTTTSKDPVRRAMIAKSVAGAYSSLDGDNRLESVRVRIGSHAKENTFRSWRNMDPSILSTDELGKLIQLPIGELQEEYGIGANARVEIEIPSIFLGDGILAGTATDRGKTYNIHIPTKSQDFLFTPRGFVGSPRMGKDQAAINLVVEAKLKHGIGAVIPDVVNERNGHRGMADAIRDHLPPDQVIDLDLGNTDYPVYLGLESITRNIKDPRVAADRIAEELTDFLLGDQDTDKYQTQAFLREAAKAALGNPLDLKLMFLSDSFRAQRMEELGDLFDMDIWHHYNRLKEGQQNQLFQPIMKRLALIESEFLKPIFYQTPNPEVDLYRWIQEGKVVLLRIPTGQISERAIQLLMYWIVMNVFLIKVAQGGREGGTFLVLNEPHQFLSDGLVHFLGRMLAEGPKYRLAPVIIFQSFAQFRQYPSFVELMTACSINWHLFKNTNVKTYERLASVLRPTFQDPREAMEATKAYQYVACWMDTEGQYMPPFVVDALPLVGDRYPTYDNSKLTLEHSRKYGRPIAQVLADIRQRNKSIFT